MLTRLDRAKQFLPFDALKGLQEELRKKEIEYEEKKELSEDSLERLSEKLNEIDRNDNVLINYYMGGKYNKIKGKVIEINSVKKRIILENDIIININDIIDIEKIYY